MGDAILENYLEQDRTITAETYFTCRVKREGGDVANDQFWHWTQLNNGILSRSL